MAPRLAPLARFPITTTLSLASKRTPALARLNSNTSTSRAARVLEMAAQADKPSALETAVPVMWAISGGLIYTAWNRVEEKSGVECCDKLLIV